MIREFMTIVDRLFRLVEAEPSLAPAIKFLPTGQIFRGRPGQLHHDVGTAHGLFGVGWKDNPNLLLGFIDHKGRFLDRSRALEYARQHDLLHDMAQRYIATDGTPAELGASFLKPVGTKAR
jgi:hypothetical protein